MFLHQLAPPPASFKVEQSRSPFCSVTRLGAQWVVVMQYNSPGTTLSLHCGYYLQKLSPSDGDLKSSIQSCLFLFEIKFPLLHKIFPDHNNNDNNSNNNYNKNNNNNDNDFINVKLQNSPLSFYLPIHILCNWESFNFIIFIFTFISM